MQHTVSIADEQFVWDDVAGTVEGDGAVGRMLGRQLDAIRADPGPVDYSDVGRVLVLEDPAHDPRDFWWLVTAYVHHSDPGLPPILRDIEPTPAQAHEPPRDGDGRPLTPGIDYLE